MAKKRKKKSKKSALPANFWRQVAALSLFVIAGLNLFTWFGSGGSLLDFFQKMNMAIFGYGVFILPIILVYLGIEAFRAEDNKIPFAIYFPAFLMLILFSGFFGLILGEAETPTGGWIGDMLNKMFLAMLNETVATIIYILLIMLMTIFILKISPKTVIDKVIDLLAKRPKTVDNFKPKDHKKSTKFELVEGVPTTESAPKTEKKFKAIDNSIGRSEQPKEDKPETALVSVRDPNWKMPPLTFLSTKQSPADAGNVKQNADIIKNTLHEFNIEVDMTGANVGPKVTQYTLTPPSGVKLTKIGALENNIALNLAAESIRIEAPIPGKRAVGIEVPNVRAADVRLRALMETNSWRDDDKKLSFAIGRDITGKEIIESLNEMPHLLIAGQTGSGKSVMINTLLMSLLYKNSPSDLKLILVDPKQVEMAPYEDIPHLLTPIITDASKTVSALKWAVSEMERRYKLLASVKKRSIQSYNQYILEQNKTIEMTDENGNVQEHQDGAMPFIVVVIDEMADLMMVAQRDVETLVSRIAAKARAVGIHLVLATQRPSVNVVTGLIKANIPARIAFTVASQVDSRTILDQVGAEKLLGKGDMLITTAKIVKPIRIQGALVTDEEVIKITDYLRQQMPPQYNDEIINQDVNVSGGGLENSEDGDLLMRAAQACIEAGKGSTSYLQRKLRIGYSRAARLMDELEEAGVVGPADGSRPRDILITNLEELK